MEQTKIDRMSNVIAKKLAEVIEAEEKSSTPNLEQVLKFIRESSSDELEIIYSTVKDTDFSLIDNEIEKYLEDSSEYIKISDIDEEVVEDINLDKKVMWHVIKNMCTMELKDTIKDMIDYI